MKKTEDTNKIIKRCLSTPNMLHVREAAEGEAPSRTITGYAILFNTPSEPLWSDDDSEAREMIAPGAVSQEFLDSQDIKMTMFHDNHLLLARSDKGEGTLTYSIDDKGVAFEFDAPNTVDGDKALELVRRGDIKGCSFAFSTRYYNRDFVERTSETAPNGTVNITYTVKSILGIYDFTLAANPYYPDTSVEARELTDKLRDDLRQAPAKKTNEEADKQLREMRQAAQKRIF